MNLSPATLFVVLSSVLSGCLGGISPVRQIDTGLQPNNAERILERTFVRLQIPLAEKAMNGRVRSGSFDPQQVWGSLTASRVSCEAGQKGDARMAPEPYELEINATVRSRSRAGTRIDLDSFGWGRGPDGHPVRCFLKEGFAQEILAGVRSDDRW